MNTFYKEFLKAKIKKIFNDSEIISIMKNPGLKGRIREVFISELLIPYLTPNIGICNGIITDYLGNQSAEIDIILYDKNVIPPIFFTSEEGIVPIEAVLSTIEIKSILTLKELEKSIKNARTVKVLKPDFIEIKPVSSIKDSAACYIFAYDTDIGKGKELNYLKEYVDRFNKTEVTNVYVPISGLCIANNKFIFCSKACKNPEFKNIESDKQYKEVIGFLLGILDTSTYLSKQRSEISLRKYIEC